jgi:hypothetical protein
MSKHTVRSSVPVISHDRDVEVDVPQSKLGEMLVQPTYHGYDGLRGFDREWREAFENVETNYDELIEAGEQSSR